MALYCSRDPAISEPMLEACATATAAGEGLKGAMYPWQSGSSDREENQRLHLNPRSGRWLPDRSHLQRHVNIAIAYNLYHYYQVTKDTKFMSFYGAEMMAEIACFWSSLATFNDRLDRYEIFGVMGPDEYREKYADIQHLDRILESEDDTPNRYKASKQADVLMLFYLLSAEELEEIFESLGYPFDHGMIPRNIDYYLKRTSHGSTLSNVVHSWVLLRSNREQSWKLFQKALESDVCDIQGGTTPEGIHLGAMAGIVDQLQREYTGVVTRDDVLWFNPRLPKELERFSMRLRYRRHFLEVVITSDRLKISTLRNIEAPIRIGFVDRVHELRAGEALEFSLRDASTVADDPT